MPMAQTEPLLLQVQTTLSSVDDAHTLAAGLVQDRLAFCAQIGAAVESVYPWQGRIERQPEIPLTLKTTPAVLPALKARLLQDHPYDVPELLVLPVIETHDAYLAWARDWIDGGPQPEQRKHEETN